MNTEIETLKKKVEHLQVEHDHVAQKVSSMRAALFEVVTEFYSASVVATAASRQPGIPHPNPKLESALKKAMETMKPYVS